LHQVSHPRQPSGDVRRAHKLLVSKREVQLVEVKYCEDTWPGHQLEASRKQHKILCKRLKAKKVILHTILLGEGGSIYTSHILNHLEELGLGIQKAHETALYLHAHSVLYAHELTTTRHAPEKKPIALKVLVWSRGRLVTLQILTHSSFSLVEETHGSLGQCVSFSLIDEGSGFVACAGLNLRKSFLLFLSFWHATNKGPPRKTFLKD